MVSNGTIKADGILQRIAHPIVPGMASPVMITHHMLKLLCWLLTTWKALFLPTFGSFETYFLCARLEIQIFEDVLETFCLEI